MEDTSFFSLRLHELELDGEASAARNAHLCQPASRQQSQRFLLSTRETGAARAAEVGASLEGKISIFKDFEDRPRALFVDSDD